MTMDKRTSALILCSALCQAACGSSSPSGKPAAVAGGGGGDTSSGGSGNSSSGGAASSSGGGGGADMPAQHVVSACPATGNAAAVGKWVNVTPQGVSLDPKFNGFNTGVNAFVFDPSNTATLYLGTCAQGIWKSTDCGATWTHINTGTHGKEIDSGRVWTMAVDPVDPKVIYSNAGYGPYGLFKSTDGGVNWTQLFETGSDFATNVDYSFVEFLAMDPQDHKHLVVSTHAACHGAAEGPTCFAESTDAGATWRLIKVDPTMGFEGVGHVILNRTTWLNFTGIAIFVTKDSGATWSKTYTGGAVNQSGELYKGSDGMLYTSTYAGVAKSSDGLAWTVIDGSPHADALAGDGTTLFVSGRQLNPPYQTATGDYSQWSVYPADNVNHGSWLMRYDKDHHLLYTSNETGGFWRVQIE